MNNNTLNETDGASDEIKGETYSITERWIILLVIYIVSLILCIIYMCFRIDAKQFSFSLFVLCLIYSSFFVMLNVISLFDLLYSNEVGMVKFVNMISIYYDNFEKLDKILGFLIFNIVIDILESGYYSIWKKFFDCLIRIRKRIPTHLFIIIVRLIIAGIILGISIKYKERFNLGNKPLDYIRIILDVFGMLKIYSNVGFFMIHLILDYRRKKDQLKIDRYFRYSKIKIIEKTEKYMKKVNDSYNELKKDAKIFEINKHPDYREYLKKIYKEMKEKVIEYGYEVNNEENNLHFNNIPNNNNINDNNDNTNSNYNINLQGPEINSNNTMAVNVYSNQYDFQNNTKQIEINKEDNTNDKVKKDDFDPSNNIRKFKKAVRKINKLKKLYHEIDKEKEEDSKRLSMNKKCTIKFVILFIAFSIVLITDFLLPITFDPEDDFTKSAEPTGKRQKFDSIETLIIAVILIYPFSVLLSSYTIIMIYATNRKNYISGDYLYDKQINDNINLLKTVQIICGYSFPILYCNIYFWRASDTHGHYGKPKFYETSFIPDYTFKQGITVFMIAKIIVIIGSMIGSYYFSSWEIFKNDLGELDKSDDSKYDQSELNKIYKEKGGVVHFLDKQ